ncbi:hypothetical protein [Branchiibius hedensis]|uniref:hypothetical protein n=1 Tax=Branchiibius hedensis TaxID=672460 RepID=UPI001475D0B6|nr:hypothetical protein [Branchiibius hedensis]
MRWIGERDVIEDLFREPHVTSCAESRGQECEWCDECPCHQGGLWDDDNDTEDCE